MVLVTKLEYYFRVFPKNPDRFFKFKQRCVNWQGEGFYKKGGFYE